MKGLLVAGFLLSAVVGKETPPRALLANPPGGGALSSNLTGNLTGGGVGALSSNPVPIAPPETETALKNRLLAGYRRDSLPPVWTEQNGTQKLSGGSVDVQVGMMIRAVTLVDHIRSEIVVNVWFRMVGIMCGHSS